MNLRLITGFTALGCALFASCTPYNEQANKKLTHKPTQKTATSVEQQKIQEQRDLMKQKEELAKKELAANATPDTTAQTTQTTPPRQTSTPPLEEKRAEYKFANKVPGKDGFVFSPYNNKVVDVRDIPSGTLVQDPTYTGAGKGYFRVP
jgi:hypothetical protein